MSSLEKRETKINEDYDDRNKSSSISESSDDESSEFYDCKEFPSDDEHIEETNTNKSVTEKVRNTSWETNVTKPNVSISETGIQADDIQSLYKENVPDKTMKHSQISGRIEFPSDYDEHSKETDSKEDIQEKVKKPSETNLAKPNLAISKIEIQADDTQSEAETNVTDQTIQHSQIGCTDFSSDFEEHSKETDSKEDIQENVKKPSETKLGKQNVAISKTKLQADDAQSKAKTNVGEQTMQHSQIIEKTGKKWWSNMQALWLPWSGEKNGKEERSQTALSENKDKKDQKRMHQMENIPTDGNQQHFGFKAHSLSEEKLKTFIEKIGLHKFFPGKLELSDIMTIESYKKEKGLTQLGRLFAQRLIMMNFTCRDTFIRMFLKQLKAEQEARMSYKIWKCVEALVRTDVNTQIENLSPLDVCFAVLKCSSPILQQILISKLFMCKLAIPLIFPPIENEPTEIIIWPLRSLIIESGSENDITQTNAVSCKCHVVSFVRIGRPSYSKSKLINEILNEQYHNTFFTKDCPLGTTKRTISDGIVEASWYLPSKKSSMLQNVTVFVNLRGDGCFYSTHIQVISNMSNVLVVLLDVDRLEHFDIRRRLDELYEPDIAVILAIHTKENNVRDKVQSYLEYIVKRTATIEICVLSEDGNDRSTSEIKEEMREMLHKLLKLKTAKPFIEQVRDTGTNTDEDKPYFKKTQTMAKNVMEKIPKNRPLEKEKLVPLQGDLWHSWSKKAKEVKKSSKNHGLEEISIIEIEMNEERKKQALLCQELGPFMKTFLHSLQDLKSSSKHLSLFVSWLKYFLDERCRKIRPKAQARYKTDWQNLKSSKDKNDDLKKALEKSEADLAEASFGIEHLCREMGQIYEALTKFKNDTSKYLVELKKNIPDIAAQLLCLGLPFEVMDGDAANVPILWVNAVFQHLKKKLGDKRLLALSVLGIQSSGKSTLLNAMFGLQFAVSAGRCTRGVFLQLVPVEGGKFPFDYVLVIDTEGLRAPELSYQKFSHDNELATFVIGLGDITIVNIKGENTAEMTDVLQIAVHAFLRLMLANKNLNLKQKCIFIHQNVQALDAADKMMYGRQKFIDNLDNMTREAADQECISGIQSFSQVIEFDIEKCVWYFSNLWSGDPPMAPSNPGYSDNVSAVKDAILYQLAKGRDTYLTISDTICRIKDLWEGILKDDFVFSFRNSLELKAYNNIERKVFKLTWNLEKTLLEFVKSFAQIELVNCKNEEELQFSVLNIYSHLNKKVRDTVSELLKELDAFIENNSLKDVIVQWRQNKINRINCKADELIGKAKCEILNTKEEIRIRKLKNEQRTAHEIEINEKAKELARNMKGKAPSEEVLTNKFEQMWVTWMMKFHAKNSSSISSITMEVKNLTWEKFPTLHTYLLNDWDEITQFDFSKHENIEKSFPSSLITEKCFAIHNILGILNRVSFSTWQMRALTVAKMMLMKVDSKLEEYKVEDARFDILYVTEIFDIIENEYDDFNKVTHKQYNFNLLPPFLSMLICYVACFLSTYFKKIQEAYNNKHSPQAQMKEYKNTVWTLFKNIVESKTEEVIAVGFFKEAIIKETKAYVSQLLHIDAQDKILSMIPNGKYGLIKQILKDDRVIEDFSRLIIYIKDASEFANRWISNLFDELLFKNDVSDDSSLYCEFARKRVSRIFAHLKDAIRTATNTAESDIKQWIEVFIQQVRISFELPISVEVFIHVIKSNVYNCGSFGQLLIDELGNIEESVVTTFRSITAKTVKWTTCPVSDIMNKFWGCKAKCMFCGEPCMNTDSNHVEDGHLHKCLQHRPEGLIGFYHVSTGKAAIEFCNHSIDSDQRYRFNENEEFRPYRNYKDEFPEWDIAPNSDVSIFWKWIFCKYKENLTEFYGYESPGLPENWLNISKEEALDSL